MGGEEEKGEEEKGEEEGGWGDVGEGVDLLEGENENDERMGEEGVNKV